MARVVGGVSDGQVIDRRSFFQVGGAVQMIPGVDNELFTLRGYRARDFLGMRAAVATLEYRFPLRLIETGPATEPVFFRKLSGYLFVDTGNAWSGPMYLKEFKTGAGAGMRLTTDFFYQRLGGYALDVGFEYGFDRGGVSRVYFSLALLW
jgi:outer membrane protein assembly factor BamA